MKKIIDEDNFAWVNGYNKAIEEVEKMIVYKFKLYNDNIITSIRELEYEILDKLKERINEKHIIEV